MGALAHYFGIPGMNSTYLIATTPPGITGPSDLPPPCRAWYLVGFLGQVARAGVPSLVADDQAPPRVQHGQAGPYSVFFC